MTELTATPWTSQTTTQEVLNGMTLTNKTYVITGAGSGLGLEATRALCQAGARVIVAIRRPDDWPGLLQSENAPSLMQNAVPVALDLAHSETIAPAAQAIANLCPQGIDGLICNAGITLWEDRFATHHKATNCNLRSIIWDTLYSPATC